MFSSFQILQRNTRSREIYLINMIIVRLSGGIGNQMFQYACGRAVSLQSKTQLALDHSFLEDKSNAIFYDTDSTPIPDGYTLDVLLKYVVIL